MGRKNPPGLYQRNGIWHIDKRVRGKRICESSGESNLAKAEEFLALRIDEARQADIYGVRPTRSFRVAATKYLKEGQHKRRIADEALHLRQLDEFIGDLPLDSVHMGSLQSFIEMRRKKGIKTKSINLALGVVRHILNVAASEWIDSHGLTWLQSPPKIKLLRVTDAREPYPMSWDEQAAFFQELPPHLAKMALFNVNTGTRNREVCQLRWEWEVPVSQLETSVFIIPKEYVKNSSERMVILNRVAQSVIEEVRGINNEYVFTYKGKPIEDMNSSAWRRARSRVGLTQVRVHDLKHTFGRRLRSMGVSFEDRQDLLGHSSGRITTHYSSAELQHLIDAANKGIGGNSRKSPALVLLKQNSRKR